MKHILVPTALDDSSHLAERLGFELAEHFCARVSLLYVCRSPAPEINTRVIGAFDADMYSKGVAHLANLAVQIGGRRARSELLVRTGEVASATLRAARELACELIVIARHSAYGQEQLPARGVTDWIVHHAPCIVLVATTQGLYAPSGTRV